MKLFKNIFLLALGAVALSSCDKDYSLPPLEGYVYDGPKANVTIAEVKEKVAAEQDKPAVITEDWVVKGFITGNDASGNIFKSIYVQDETAAISINVDQSSMDATYKLGQEVYINLKGLCLSVYGGQKQIGELNGYLYRMPITIFEEHVKKNGYPNPENVKPVVIEDFSTVNDKVEYMTNRLVELKNVYFENGGKNTFAEATGFGNENVKDAKGNVIVVRTSNYAKFAQDKLPVGKGNLIGILGKFRDTWQLTIIKAEDILDFDGIPVKEETKPSEGETEQKETIYLLQEFKVKNNEKLPKPWPKLNDYKEKLVTPMTFEASDFLSIRNVGGLNNIWFGANFDNAITIKDIDVKDAKKVNLRVEIGGDINDKNGVTEQDLNALAITVNGKKLDVPSKVINAETRNKPFAFDFKDIAVDGKMEIKFQSIAEQNKGGLRLYSVKVFAPAKDNGPVKPVVENK